MSYLPHLGVIVFLAATGCGSRSDKQLSNAAVTTNEEVAATVSEPDVSAVLAELTQALRRYSAEKQQVPSSLDALAAAGYLQRIPQAPQGKSFVIDTKNVRVIMK